MVNKYRLIIASQEPGASKGLLPVVQDLLQNSSLEVHVFSARWGSEVFQNGGVNPVIFNVDSDDFESDIENLIEALSPQLILTGIAGDCGNNLDHELINHGKSYGIPVLALLDSWTHYAKRITHSDGTIFKYLPDRILVMNDFARDEMIAEGYDPEIITVTGQPVFDDCKKIISQPSESKFIELLFISQPLKMILQQKPEEWNGYNEDEVFEMLVDSLRRGFNGKAVSLTLKRHPKEKSRAIQNLSTGLLKIKESIDDDMHSLIAQSDVIIGMTSTALVEAYLMNKPVISIQPNFRNYDQLVLTRAGLIPVTKTDHEINQHLSTALSRNRKSITDDTWYTMDSRATERVINTIMEYLQ